MDVPKQGAQGQINVSFGFPFTDGDPEQGEPYADPTTGGRPNIPVNESMGAAGLVAQPNPWPADSDGSMAGPHGPEDRPAINAAVNSTGADGGHDVSFDTRRSPSQKETARNSNNPPPFPLA